MPANRFTDFGTLLTDACYRAQVTVISVTLDRRSWNELRTIATGENDVNMNLKQDWIEYYGIRYVHD